MEKIEDFAQVCQYLKEGTVVCIQDRRRKCYFGMREEKIHVQGAQAHYVLSFADFTAMFAQEAFFLYEKQAPAEISEEKDAEYYRWQHK